MQRTKAYQIARKVTDFETSLIQADDGSWFVHVAAGGGVILRDWDDLSQLDEFRTPPPMITDATMHEMDELTPRELDAWLAQNLFGWKGEPYWISDEQGEDPYLFPPGTADEVVAANDQDRNCIVPFYSSDWTYTGQVIEARPGDRQLALTPAPDGEWCAMFGPASYAVNKSPQMAICRAAKLAVEWEEKGQ